MKHPQHSVCFQERPLVIAVRHALPYLVGLSLALAIVQNASSRSSDSAAAFTATQLVRQFTLKNTVSQVAMGMQGYISEINGEQRARGMGLRPDGYPLDMGSVPATVNLPQRDGAGRPLGYCAWDNSSSVATAEYNAGLGVSNPLVYAIVSPGLNGTMQTTCADVLLNGAGLGDDHVQVAAPMQVSSVQYKSAVASVAALPTPAENGDIRLVRDTNKLYSYDSVSGWKPVQAGPFETDAGGGAGAIAYTTGKVTVADFQAATATITGALSGSSATFTGAVTANTLSGNGSGLTDLNAGNFSSGILSPQFGGTGVNAAAAANGTLLIGNGSGFSLGSLIEGAGIDIATAAGSITISNSGVTRLIGTANQVITSGETGEITLSLPQDIAMTSVPTFGGMMLNGDLMGANATFSGVVTVGSLAAQRLDVSTSAGGVTNPNLIVGTGAMLGAQTGAGGNSAIGISALAANTSGRFNTANGYKALESNTSGFRNTALGTYSLRVNTTGDSNTGVGSFGLEFNTTGTDNVALGAYGLYNNTVGNFNTAVGSYAGNSNTTGSNNTFIGNFANPTTGALTYSTAIGASSTVATSNTLALGRNSTVDQVVIGTDTRNDTFANTKLYVNGVTSLNGDLRGTTATFSGAVNALSFAGDGSGLNNLNASNFTNGIVPVARGGTGLDGSAAPNGSLLIGNGTGYSLNTLTGTANQVNVTNGAGTITLSLPQNIATTSTPTFSGMTSNAAITFWPGTGNKLNLAHNGFGTQLYGFGVATEGGLVAYMPTNNRFSLRVGTTGIDGTEVFSVSHAGLIASTGGISTTTGTFSGNVTVGGSVTATGLVDAYGGVLVRDGSTLEFGPTGSTSDQIFIQRSNPAVDQSRLQIILGDNNEGFGQPVADEFQIGNNAGGTFTPRFRVAGSGDVIASGSVTANSFSGNGSALTNLNANNFTAGTLPVARGGTGLSATPTNGQLLIGNGTGYTLGTLTGTANQVNVTNGAGTITLSLPQSIATTSTPTFGGMTLNGGLTGTTATFSGAVVGNTLKATLFDAISSQGAHLQWNRDSSTGRTYLINQKGSGSGGISFGESTTGNVYTENMFLSSAGNLTVVGAIAANAASTSTFGGITMAGALSGTSATFSTDVAARHITASGSLQAVGFRAITSQGTHIQWNRGSGDGRTYFVNQKGLGTGGMSFGESTTGDAYTQNMFLDASGNLSVVGSVTANSFSGTTGAFSGNTTVGGNLTVTGTTTLNGAVAVNNSAITFNDVLGDKLKLYSGFGFGINGDNLTSYIPGAGQRFSLRTGGNFNGTEVFTVTGGGLITSTGGISTTTGTFSGGLTVTGSSNLNGPVRLAGGAPGQFIYIGQDNPGGGVGDNVYMRYYARPSEGENTTFVIGTITGDAGDHFALMPGPGNVGIGTEIPTAKLDVVGTAKFSGNTTVGGTLGVTGATTLTGALTANGGISSTTGAFSGLASAASLQATTATAINVQGAYLQWNRDGGRTFLVNQRGLGPGGISFGEVTTGNAYTENMALSSTGNLTVVGSVTANSFSGNGSGLTNLNASNFSTGTMPVARGGTGLSTTPTNGQLLIGNGTGYTLGTLTGTANQVNVTNGAGTITLSLPQAIATTSTPTFGGMTVNGELNFNNVLGDKLNLFGGYGFGINSNNLTAYIPAGGNRFGVRSGGTYTGTEVFSVSAGGDTTVSGTLAVTGNTTLTGALTANGGINSTTGTFSGNMLFGTNGTGNTSMRDLRIYSKPGMAFGAWDHLQVLVDGFATTFNAGGAATGIVFNVGNGGSGDVGAQTYNKVLTLAPDQSATFAGAVNVNGATTLNGAVAVNNSAITFNNILGDKLNLFTGYGFGINGSNLTAYVPSAATRFSVRTGGTSTGTEVFSVTGGGNTTVSGTLAVTGNTTLTGALTANGGISSTTGAFSGLTSAASLQATTATAINVQGAYLQWNRDGGRTFLVNQKGLGVGGISFGEVTTGNVYTENMALSSTGNLTVVGSVTANSFVGNGSGLTNLNASNFTTGTVPVARGGTGLSATPTNGQLLIGNGTGYTLGTLTGTANQVNVTNGAGTITLSLPQSIATTSTPTFGGMTVNGELSFNNVLGDKLNLFTSYGFGINNNNLTAYIPSATQRFTLRTGGTYTGTEVFTVTGGGLITSTGGISTTTGTFSGNLSVGGNLVSNLNVTQGNFVRFGHANQFNGDDGKIGAGLFGEGLNIVGTKTAVAGSRQITVYGNATLNENLAVTGATTLTGVLTANGGINSTNGSFSGAVTTGGLLTANAGMQLATSGALRFGVFNENTDDITVSRLYGALDRSLFRITIGDNAGSFENDVFQIGSMVSGTFTDAFRVAPGSGDVIAKGYMQATSFNVSSDRRLKKNITAQNNASVLDRLEQLQTYSYEYINNPAVGRRIGVIAQEVQTLFPDAVIVSAENGMMSVDYNALGAMAAMGVGQLNSKFKVLDGKVTLQGEKLFELDGKVAEHNTRIGSLEDWKTEAVARMDNMQGAIDLNIQKIAENAVAIQTNTKAIERLDDALLTLDGTVKGNTDAIAAINARWARSFTAADDGSSITINAVELKVSNFTAQQMRANAVYTQRLEAEMARIAELEVNNLRANTAVANTVQAEQVNTGSVQVYAGVGMPAVLFAAKADGHYTVSTSSLDGSYATATVIVNAGQAKVVSGASEGIELVAEGNMVKAIAAGKSIKASWIKMG